MTFLSVALWVLGPHPGASADVLDLQWRAPPSCPERSEILRQVNTLLNDTPAPRPTQIVGSVSKDADNRWTLELRVDNDIMTSHRTLDSESCSDLAEATALIAAVALDPFSSPLRPGDPSDTSAPAAEAPTPANTPAEPAPDRPDTPTPFSPPEVRWSVGVGGGAAWSSNVVGVVRVLTTRERRRLAVRLGTDVWMPRQYEDGDPAPRGVSVGHVLGHVRACVLPTRRALDVPLCAGVSLGGTFARSFGTQPGRREVSLAAAGFTSIGLRWRPGRAAPGAGLFVDAEASSQATRPRFHTADRPPAYIGSVVALSVVAGAEVWFDPVRPR